MRLTRPGARTTRIATGSLSARGSLARNCATSSADVGGLSISARVAARFRARCRRLATMTSPASEPSTALLATGLGRRFGDRWAVRDVGLEVQRGEVLGLLGPNGAGKTTTVRLLTALIEP